jgi:hypothetical protein
MKKNQQDPTIAGLERLARTFPTLAEAPFDPWDPDKFAGWAAQNLSSGGLHAARFVLSIWNSHSAPAGRLRRQLLEDFDRMYMDAVYATPDRPDSLEKLLDRVVSAYRRGDRPQAHAAAVELARHVPKC